VLRTLVYVLYFIVILTLVRMAGRILGQLLGLDTQARPSGQTRRGTPRPVEDLVRDRICNTHVPRSRALTAVVEGHEEHFCSEACRQKALAAARRAS